MPPKPMLSPSAYIPEGLSAILFTESMSPQPIRRPYRYDQNESSISVIGTFTQGLPVIGDGTLDLRARAMSTDSIGDVA